MQHNRPPDYGYVVRWAKLPKWTASEFAHLLSGREPPDSDFLEARGLGRTDWGQDYNFIFKAVIRWLEDDSKVSAAFEYTDATPAEFIKLATSYGFDVPIALKKAVEKYQEQKSPSPQQKAKENTHATNKPEKQRRDNALHIELKALFAEWGKPATNKECWNKLKGINFDDRDDTVVQSVVSKNDRNQCKIFWHSPDGVERSMLRATFENRMGKIRKKFHC